MIGIMTIDQSITPRIKLRIPSPIDFPKWYLENALKT